MDAERFDALSRSLSHSSPRRRVLTGLASSLGALMPLAREEADARKKRRGKRKPPPAGATMTPRPLSACARACCSNCTICARRGSGPLLCGQGVIVACDFPCRSDFDCQDREPNGLYRYCITATERVATGQVDGWCEAPGGHCADVQPCEGPCSTECCATADCAPAERCRDGACVPIIGGR